MYGILRDHDGNEYRIDEIQDVEFTENDVESDYPKLFKTTNTISASFELVGSAAKRAAAYILGLHQIVIDCCPNKKVVYLANHAKKKRIRNKNFNRAIKIIEREVE